MYIMSGVCYYYITNNITLTLVNFYFQPIFLNRTLSYMKRRMSRSNKSRIGFKVDSLLDKKTLKKKAELQPKKLGGYMTLTFLGFYDKSLDDPRDYQVKVETLLVKISYKKRKESSSSFYELSVSTYIHHYNDLTTSLDYPSNGIHCTRITHTSRIIYLQT